ncbi:MAG: hypothetical protein RTU92_01880 [Candidatus Thorarchaeota archaeon]
MNAKVVAGAVIVVVIVGVAGILLFMNPAPMTDFHIEEQLPDDLTQVSLFFGDLEDTNLTITFVDDESLFYSMDIALYESTTADNAFDAYWIASTTYRFDALTRIRSLNVTLGTGIPYSFGVWGVNLDSSIVYDNGALVGSDVTYEASGEFLFTLKEDVVMDSDLDISTRGISSSSFLSALYLDIDLQTGTGGELQIGTIPISFVERVGWTWDGFDSYDTTAGSPTVDITVSLCDQIYANLLN